MESGTETLNQVVIWHASKYGNVPLSVPAFLPAIDQEVSNPWTRRVIWPHKHVNGNFQGPATQRQNNDEATNGVNGILAEFPCLGKHLCLLMGSVQIHTVS